MKHKRGFIFLALAFIFSLSASAQSQAHPFQSSTIPLDHTDPHPEFSTNPTEFNYEIQTDLGNEIELYGAPYSYEIDNCRGDEPITNVHKKVHRIGGIIEFGTSGIASTQLDIGANSFVSASLQNEIHTIINRTNEVILEDEDRTEFIVPRRSKGLINIQWKRIWAHGQLHIQSSSEQTLETIPFRVLIALIADSTFQTVSCPLVVCEDGAPNHFWNTFNYALSNAADYMISNHVQALDERTWLQNSYTREYFVQGLLRGIEVQWEEIEQIQWDLSCLSSPMLDDQFSTPADEVHSMYAETMLQIEGTLKCPGRRVVPNVEARVAISGKLRMDTLYPSTDYATTRVIFWETIERPVLLFQEYCDREISEAIDYPKD